MKKWTFQLNVGNVALILLGTAVNLLGRYAAKQLFLPIWLDSVGTFLSGVLLGPLAGALSGAMMNCIVGFFEPGQEWFSFVSIAGGVAVGFLFPRDRKINSFSVIATALFAGFVMTVVSTPLNMYLNGGYVGHPWGDALVDMLAGYINLRTLRCVAGELLVNMPDKAVSIFIALGILYLVRRHRESGKDGGTAAGALALTLASAAAAMALLSAPARAVDYNSEYAAVIYGKNDGLISAEINAVAQTADGYIWVGAYSGLYRYNGSRFEQIHLDERVSNAMCLYSDSAGDLWIGTNDRGLARYRCETGDVGFYTAAGGLTSDSVRSICEDGLGNVYVGTTEALCRINSEGGITTFSKYPQISNVNSLVCLDGGRIAGVTARGLLFLIMDDKLVFTGEYPDQDAIYTTAAYDGGVGLLVGSSKSDIFNFRVGADGSLKLLNMASIAGLSDVDRICYVPKANGYFVAASRGLAFVDRQLCAQILAREDFNSAVTDVITDYQDNIWFTSSKHGVMKLAYDPFINVSERAGLDPAAVNALLLDGSRLYVGTDFGANVLDVEIGRQVDDPATGLLAGERVRHLMRDCHGNLWVSTYGQMGLVCVAPDGSMTSFGKEDKSVLGSRFRFSMELIDGTILAASTEGLNFIWGGAVKYTIGEDQGLDLPKILCAVECPDGTILAGSDGDGVYRIMGGQVVGHIGAAEGLESLVVLRIVPCGNGWLYVTSNGIFYQEPGSAVRKLNAFPYGNNYDVFLAADGKAWVSSSAGIFVADADELVRDEGYRYLLLNHNRGFDTTQTANSWNAASGDELYLCCTDGVRRINTRTYDDLNEDYNIVLASFLDENGEVGFRDGAYQIDAGRSWLQIRPAVLNYAMSNPLVSVRLDGAAEPEKLVHQNELEAERYLSLPFGDFKLYVSIIDELTGEVKKEAVFPLHKEAELYEHTYYKIYLIFVSAMLVAFLAWTIAKMSNMAVIHRQYEQIREAKEEAEYANQAKSHFLASMSHEIRTPINAVLGMDEMILRESTEKEIRGYAADIYTAGNTLLSLINDILDSSKIESGKMEIVPVEYELAALVRDLYNMVSQRARTKDLALELSVDADLPRGLYGDDVRIRQVITNILTNAVKYTPSGTVWFRVGGRREDGEAVLRFEVEDTGIGIKEEDLPKLFEAYRRIEESRNRRIEGTGLGMSIATRLLHMMDSRLEVESEYGKGSRFWFDLRQKITDPEPIGDFNEIMKAPEERYHHEGAFIAPDARVLVVDDNAMNLKVFRSLLKVTQIRIAEASGGAEALALAEAERFDVVFMDHMMPDMDGVETMQRMRRLAGYDEIPIYVLTANAVTGAKEQYLEAGFDGFVSKPVASDKLEQALREALPGEKLLPFEETDGANASASARSGPPEDLPVIDGLDWGYAWLHLPERELLESTVRDFREVVPLQAEKLDRMWAAASAAPEDEDALAAYRIQVHGMKSAAATVGIVPLAGMAKLLEYAARDGDTGTIEKLHGVFLAEWRSYAEKLAGLFEPENIGGTEKEAADADMLRALLTLLRGALEDLDVDAADGVMEKLRGYRMAPEVEALLPELAAAVTDLDEDAAHGVMERIEKLLS